MELGTNQRYFDALVNSLATAEDELETVETYITEENFDEFFEMYLAMQSRISHLKREIRRVAKELGIKPRQLRNIILT
mgnify:FL=1